MAINFRSFTRIFRALRPGRAAVADTLAAGTAAAARELNVGAHSTLVGAGDMLGNVLHEGSATLNHSVVSTAASAGEIIADGFAGGAGHNIVVGASSTYASATTTIADGFAATGHNVASGSSHTIAGAGTGIADGFAGTGQTIVAGASGTYSGLGTGIADGVAAASSSTVAGAGMGIADGIAAVGQRVGAAVSGVSHAAGGQIAGGTNALNGTADMTANLVAGASRVLNNMGRKGVGTIASLGSAAGKGIANKVAGAGHGISSAVKGGAEFSQNVALAGGLGVAGVGAATLIATPSAPMAATAAGIASVDSIGVGTISGPGALQGSWVDRMPSFEETVAMADPGFTRR